MWKDRSVLITGHTGFKGGWLALWLARRGANVHGYALDSPTTFNFFQACDIRSRIHSSTIADIRDLASLQTTLQQTQPEIVFHLAAQSLVRKSYHAPLETFSANVMGTATLLEAVRHADSVKAVVNITTDKCYSNQEWPWPYRENEPLGGDDPYSASKACAELVSHAYRTAFLADAGIHLATARAGNVIGGGDWAENRLLPDFFRALNAGKPFVIRSPQATRPWQHVLEPLAGYLLLAERLLTGKKDFAEAWNFGPEESDSKSVRWIAEWLCSHQPGAMWQIEQSECVHEALALKVDSSKAKHRLGWMPRWSLEQALFKTLQWNRHFQAHDNMATVSLEHIADYESGHCA